MADAFEGWAIVELMGHRKLAGHVSEQEIAGQAFLRLDVHGQDATITQFYSAGAVYCITPATEDVARKAAARWLMPAPVSRFELEPLRSAAPDPWVDDAYTDPGEPVDAVIHAPGCMNPDCQGECDG